MSPLQYSAMSLCSRKDSSIVGEIPEDTGLLVTNSWGDNRCNSKKVSHVSVKANGIFFGQGGSRVSVSVASSNVRI